MTSTSKSARVRDLAVSTGGNAVQAAKLFGGGATGVGLHLTARGYSLARAEIEKRKARSSRRTAPRVSPRTRRVVVFGTLFGAVAGIAVVAARRRHTVQPPADAPPRLADYETQLPTPVNGQSAHVAKQ